MTEHQPIHVVLLSGGLDSTTLIHHVRKNYPNDGIIALSFRYGQRHEEREIQCAQIQAAYVNCRSHVVADMTFMRDVLAKTSALISTSTIDVPTEAYDEKHRPITYVPFRNMLMLSIAAAMAEAHQGETVWYGAHRGDENAVYWDCSQRFMRRIQDVWDLNNNPHITLCVPFVDYTKAYIVEYAASLLDVPLDKTWSCYNGREKACGVCGTCRDRILAFAACNLQDPIEYETGSTWESVVAAASRR
jgi:7-cyano-7-deazaguanine synthase